MSLQVWLPLNGNLNNQGAANPTLTQDTTVTYSTSGKIGSCFSGGIFHTDATTAGQIFADSNITISFWFNNNGAMTGDCAICGFYCNQGYGPQRMWDFFNYPSKNDFHWSCSDLGGGVLYGVFTDNVWHHVVIQKDSSTLYIYIDNVLKHSASSSNPGYSYEYSYYIGASGTSYLINDFRVYNHCISNKEREELAKGLVLHYKLNDGYMEPTVNYGYPPKLSSSSYSPGWDSSLHPNAVTVTGWAGGYNGGVSNPTTGYHAMWNIIDNIPTMVFQNHNSIISQTGRWLGISSNTLSYAITAGVKYTISYEQRSIDNLGGYTTCGRYYKYSSSSSQNFHDGCPTIGKNTVVGTWQKFSYTFTGSSSIDGTGTNGNIYVYGHYGTESTMQVRNVQVEIKDHATPFTPSSRDIGVCYDSSGYNYNLTGSGSVLMYQDSPRYDRSCDFNQTGYFYNNSINLYLKQYTAAMWIKIPSSITAQHFLFGTFTSWTGNGMGAWRDTGGNYYSWIMRSDAETSYKGINPGSYSYDTWYHIAWVWDGTSIICYKNGEYYTSTTYGSSGTCYCPVMYIGNSQFGTRSTETDESSMSDFRLYSTALSADQIKELYNTSASIDNNGNLMIRELIES